MILHSTHTIITPGVLHSIYNYFGEELFDSIKNGEYLFVDDHFVYNAPIYIDRKENGELTLSKYARNHIKKCCVKFIWVPKRRHKNPYYIKFTSKRCYKENFTTDGMYTFGDDRSDVTDVTFKIVFNNGWNNSPPKRQIAMRQKMLDEVLDVRRKMTDDPAQCMALLLEWREMNYTELANAIERSPKTISRIAKGETTPTLETAVLICFALNLPPVLSEKLLSVLRCSFDPLNENHYWIEEALYLKYPEPLEAVKHYLSQYGVDLK